MTCVLSMPSLYTSPFNETSSSIQHNGCDFNWINSRPSHSGLSDNQKNTTPCHTEACTGSSISCRMEISDEVSESAKYGHLNGDSRKEHKSVSDDSDIEKDLSVKGKTDGSKVFDFCTNAGEATNARDLTSRGIKRKAEISDTDDMFIPPKRVSPFLNTPKERKDERKKILKISIKKLKQLSDPEFFLRRTVLVNNTTKRLQSELKEEKRRNKRRKYMNNYGVPNSNCLSDMYLFEDPFLCGVQEKITDDMTDTLIKNVLCDKTNENSEDSDSMEASDNVNTAMDHSPEQQCIDSRTFQPLSAIDENSNYGLNEGSKNLTELSKD